MENIDKAFGARRVLRRFSLSVRAGETVIVTGPNGSGKSTLLKIVAGLLRPSRGQIRWNGESNPAARRSVVGYAAPDLSLYPELSGRENLVFFAQVRGLDRPGETAQRCLDIVGLGGRGDDSVGAYSSGMRQRMRLAFALIGDPVLLLLDEPSLALDQEGVGVVARIVSAQREKNGITLLATNDAREAHLGERGVALAS